MARAAMDGGAAARRAEGLAAEAAVATWLEQRGWVVLARNRVVRGGELDVIARDGEVVVFVEVRLRRGGVSTALASITPAKVRRLVRAAERWLAEAAIDVPVRFDVVAVARRSGGEYAFAHVPAAFDAGDAEPWS